MKKEKRMRISWLEGILRLIACSPVIILLLILALAETIYLMIREFIQTYIKADIGEKKTKRKASK